MNTAPLKSFATWARNALIREVSARIAVVLSPASPQRVEQPKAVSALDEAIAAAGGGDKGRGVVADRVAYTWFNRIIALRFMDANGYTGIGVVSPQAGVDVGQPEILAEAKRANIDPEVVSQQVRNTVTGLLEGSHRSDDPQGEAYALLLADYCRHWNRAMPFMFERQGDFTELLMPANLLADGSVINRASEVLTEEVCQDVEVIGWLYQFYISERKDEVFAGFKRNLKAGADEIPSATQLFTPHWIVRYLVENSLGRLWMLNHPTSRLIDQMEFFIAPADHETNFLKIDSPEELKVVDPACGSGHMLTYAFDLLYAIYVEEGHAPSEIPALILGNNLYGIEIDPRAGALAAFALTMKARSRQRTFFNNTVNPNICVIESISFTPDELKTLLTGADDSETELAFWSDFVRANALGSLVRVKDSLIHRMEQHLKKTDLEQNLFGSELHARAERLLVQSRYLSPRYSVVVANPPYMGSRNMVGWLAEYARRSYPLSKADLFSMFIERCLSLATSGGHLGMITMQGWMFLPSFAGLRRAVVQKHRLLSMAHLGTRAFDSISGEVVSTTAFVLQVDGSPNSLGEYFRLTEFDGEAAKSARLKSALGHDPDSKIRWRVRQSVFNSVPGSPLAYWASAAELELFSGNKSVGDVSDVRAGMATGNNDLFVRQWFEVSASRLKLDAESAAQVWADPNTKWVIFNKGGDSRRWYGHLDHVLAYDRSSHALLKESGNRCPSEEYYFRECLTWSDVTTGQFAPRYMPAGSVLSTVGNSIYGSKMPLGEICCALASSTVSGMLALLNPTLHANPGDVARLPVPTLGDAHIFRDAVAIARRDWHSVETAWGFERPDWIQIGGDLDLREIANQSDESWEETVRCLAELETQNDKRQRVAFDLKESDPSEMTETERLDGVTLRRNYFRQGRWASDEAARVRALELVSYAVGCTLGRYSLDKPGLVLADQDATLQDYLAAVPAPTFMPDRDNVIPIVDGDWFEDDIVTRFRQFLRVVFGDQHFEANLRFVTESLGVKDLRDYFVKSFYKDHVQRYKKRPIYWLFSSPKGSFNALIYMHRYTPSTVSTVLNEYLREFKAKLEATLGQQERLAAGGGAPRQQAAAQKEADRIRAMLVELDEYEHDVLYPLASQQIKIDLDDGVKVNYPKFAAALKKIPGLEAGE
jgi:hypothetical protein